MSLWSLVKFFAALCVLAIMAFTGMLAYHIAVAPLGGIFARIVPHPREIIGRQPDHDFAKMLDSAELPDIDPGEKVYQKAHEFIALGKLNEGREKLTTVVETFPTSPCAPIARRIIGEMNMDRILSTTNKDGKQTYVVKKGNSFFGIAAQFNTNLDCLMHFNSMMNLKGLQPGDELTVMPLNFKILIEPQRKALSLWDGDQFIREYNIIHLGTLAATHTTVTSRNAQLNGKSVRLPSKDYRSAVKIVLFGKPATQIRGYDGPLAEAPPGVVLKSEDMEEINLLTRVGTEVEVRKQGK